MNFESLQQLRTALLFMDALICGAIERAQGAGFDPNNSLRGLVITDEDVSQELQKEPLSGLWGNSSLTLQLPSDVLDTNSTLGYLSKAFELEPLDVAILLICLAPELDNRYEKLFAYLQDDVALRRPTVNLIMNILGSDLQERFAVWERLGHQNPLRKKGILDCLPDTNRLNSPFLTHFAKLDRRVVSYLLGDFTIDSHLVNFCKLETPDSLSITNTQLVDTLSQLPKMPSVPMFFLAGTDFTGKTTAVQSLCAKIGTNLLTVDLKKCTVLELDLENLWQSVIREALLTNAVLLIQGWDAVLRDSELVKTFIWEDIKDLKRLVFICGEKMWEPMDTQRQQRFVRVNFDVPDYASRHHVWKTVLEEQAIDIPENTIHEIASKFRFTADQIHRAVQTATDLALSRNESVSLADLYQGAQAHASVKLDRLASQIKPRYKWRDLILPQEQLDQIHELVSRATYAPKVYHDWG